jgi:hypothetical protein
VGGGQIPPRDGETISFTKAYPDGIPSKRRKLEPEPLHLPLGLPSGIDPAVECSVLNVVKKNVTRRGGAKSCQSGY